MTNIEQSEHQEKATETALKSFDPDQVQNIYWSLNEAARHLDMSKGTLSKDATAGRIQWHDQVTGPRKLFAPELYGYYGERLRQRGLKQSNGNTGNSGNTSKNGVAVTTNEQRKTDGNTALELELAVLKERLRAKDEIIQLQAEQIGHLRDQNTRITGLLPPPATTQPAAAPVETPAPPKKRGFLGLFGGS